MDTATAAFWNGRSRPSRSKRQRAKRWEQQQAAAVRLWQLPWQRTGQDVLLDVCLPSPVLPFLVFFLVFLLPKKSLFLSLKGPCFIWFSLFSKKKQLHGGSSCAGSRPPALSENHGCS